jgi:hypothetical protein
LYAAEEADFIPETQAQGLDLRSELFAEVGFTGVGLRPEKHDVVV